MTEDHGQGTTKTAKASISQRIQDPEDLVRLGALAELLTQSPADLPEKESLHVCLDDPDESVRRLAVEALALAGKDGVSLLADGLADGQPATVRVGTAMALGRMGPDASPAIDPLSRCLFSEDDTLRWHAGFTFGKIGPAAIASLRQVLRSGDAKAAATAAGALQAMGPEARDAEEDIREVAASPSSPPFLRVTCLTALHKVAEDPADTLPMILEILATGDEETRVSCVEGLGYLGASVQDSIPALLQCAEDPSSGVREATALALARVETDLERAVPVLVDLLSDPEPGVRANSAIALAAFGPGASGAIPPLKRLTDDTDPWPAGCAAAAIEKIQPRESL